MKILAYNPAHDGAAVLLEGDRLVYYLESAKSMTSDTIARRSV